MNDRVRSLLREPLVHFLVVGALLAAMESIAAPEDVADARVLVVDDAIRRGLTTEWEHDHGAPPSEDELAEAVRAWVDEELLFREGILRELDRDDPRVRQRVATLAMSMLEAEHPIAEPTDEEIRAYFDAHLDRYGEDARFDFVHVFVAGVDEAARARADALLVDLRAGASPIGLGDTYPGGRHYRGRDLDALARAFGPEFVAGFADAADGAWTLRTSRTGFHLVRIDARAAASPADLERARVDVEHDLLEERRRERASQAIESLRERWRVIER
ncbi:MAG: peptidyl-prolyl cis-trans isomerase [Deltaproteobacteria bacterium]|nr:peptidyl-prolyl cis-trans isomerase [Deltaproteobacteria bacterium]